METTATVKESFRFLVSSRYNVLGTKKLIVELMAPDDQSARKLACAYNQMFRQMDTRDILVTKLFQPLKDMVNLKHKKLGICFYRTKMKNGEYKDYYCIMDENMNSLFCSSSHPLVIQNLKKLNPNLTNYSPTLLPQPLRYMPLAENGRVYIADYIAGDKIAVGTYQELVPKKQRGDVFTLLGREVIAKCLTLNQTAA
ncbi:MAG: hypothetical protein IM613_17970 [Cytophagales bacterium]|nr:hypothetical protein [Cytophagales bacterium]